MEARFVDVVGLFSWPRLAGVAGFPGSVINGLEVDARPTHIHMAACNISVTWIGVDVGRGHCFRGTSETAAHIGPRRFHEIWIWKRSGGGMASSRRCGQIQSGSVERHDSIESLGSILIEQ
ncbi:uncharacterized protein Dana_GF26363, isoform B [Drosophila ananassae]|uniref:Uncharacterized protein, isoform B n=1 Tax=Drosophila ananassae TaxID=7217 RepID=A0A0P8XL63_DROAN|nr:uncharacterized protein Dana_GF26363, isoform B [Drosophila ananassae]